ncbi:MAG: hypothetical protein IKB75_01745 [Clostridia bacterium]|nr:hypothetical protein [Clostridia bacterium]
MKQYLLGILVATLLISILRILSPEGESVFSHYKLLTSLFLLCILLAPAASALDALHGVIEGELPFPWEQEDEKSDYVERWEGIKDDASRDYITQLLTRTLEEQCSVPTGEIRCVIDWGEDGTPWRATVFLTGSAIWKDPKVMEALVEELLGCPCQSAIE